MTGNIIINYLNDNNLIGNIISADIDIQAHYNEETASIPFVNYSFAERFNPKKTMFDCKSIIVIGMKSDKIEYLSESNDKAYFSMMSYSFDYHKIMKNYLNQLIELIKNSDKTVSENNFSAYVDTGPLNERFLAVKAGLGFIGKNQNVISKEFGSLFFIGYILTNAELLPTNSNTFSEITAENTHHNACNNCNICIKKCPSKALKLLENGNSCFDYTLCRSYLTQKRGELDDFEKEIIGNSLYGCDICQSYCPLNLHLPTVLTNNNDFFPVLDELLTLSNKNFKEKYSHTGFYWRGKKVIQRNALIAQENIRRRTNALGH